MKPARIMHVHFWGDVRHLAGSVDKVIAAFAQMDEPDIELSVACPGVGSSELVGRTAWHFFAEDRLKNRIANKLLGLKLFTYGQLAELVARERPDLIHVHNRHTLLAPLLRRLPYRPLVFCHYHRKFGDFFVPSEANVLVAVSGAVRDALIAARAPKVPVEVVYNPVPVGLGVATPALGGGRPRLLYGGGRQRHKGFFELEAALMGGLAEAFDVVLCGPEFSGYNPPFPARVAGSLPSEEFLAEMRAADVVAMPSHHEGFSILVLEALGLGKLLVATQGGGLGEIVSPENALIHPVGDAEGLASCLRLARELFSEDAADRREAFREQALATARRFSPEAINRQLAAVYRKYLNGWDREVK